MMTKTMLNQEWSMTLDQAIEAEAQAQAICMQTRDFRRAYEAFVAKEKPRFAGTRSRSEVMSSTRPRRHQRIDCSRRERRARWAQRVGADGWTAAHSSPRSSSAIVEIMASSR